MNEPHGIDVAPRELSDEERATYEWQMWVGDFGETGQQRLKGASVLVSRVGGVGGLVALELAAAGIGRLVVAHAGRTRPADLNRQLLMTHDNLGKERTPCIEASLKRLNPRLEVVAVPQNINEDNAAGLVEQVDIIVDCAPLFPERFAMNRQSVLQRKPMVECAMYEMEAYLTTFVPGQTPCLACLSPEEPAWWKRRFPVIGAVSGTVACMAAVETIKLITALGQPLLGRMLAIDLRHMTTRSLNLARDPACPVCASSRQAVD